MSNKTDFFNIIKVTIDGELITTFSGDITTQLSAVTSGYTDTTNYFNWVTNSLFCEDYIYHTKRETKSCCPTYTFNSIKRKQRKSFKRK